MNKYKAVSYGYEKRFKKFEDKKNLNFNLLSDPEHKIAEKYGVWRPKKFMGKEFLGTMRTTFIIGKDGKIKEVMDKVKTTSHHADVLKFISKSCKH